jgi:hypothetical protein
MLAYFMEANETLNFSITLCDPPRTYTGVSNKYEFSQQLKINHEDVCEFIDTLIQDNKIISNYDSKNDKYNVSIVNNSFRKKPEMNLVLAYKQPTNPEERSLNQALVAVSDLKKQLSNQISLLKLSKSEYNLEKYGHTIGVLDLDLLQDLIDVMTAYKNGTYKRYQFYHIEYIVLRAFSNLFFVNFGTDAPYTDKLYNESEYSTARLDDEKLYIRYECNSYRNFKLGSRLDEKNKPMIKQIFLLFVEGFNKINYDGRTHPSSKPILLLTPCFPLMFDDIKLSKPCKSIYQINTIKIERVKFLFDIIEENQIEFVINNNGITQINTMKNTVSAQEQCDERTRLFARYDTIAKYLKIVV